MSSALVAVVAVAAFAGCDVDRLVDSRSELRVSADHLDFGAALVGGSRDRTITLSNVGREDLSVRFDAEAPFSVASPALNLPAGASVDVSVSFRPAETGSASAVLFVRTSEIEVPIALSGEGLSAETCGAPPPCQVATIDPETRACGLEALADGTACSTACIAQGVCVAGACAGASLSCDDGDACTVDSCDAQSGCRHDAVACAAPDDPCKAAVCDPLQGCVAVDVADGTSCGATDCITAHVCMSGVCQVRPAVDGMECAPATPCEDKSTCSQGACVKPVPHGLVELWCYTPAKDRYIVNYPGLPQDAQDNAYAIEATSTGNGYQDPELVSWTPGGLERLRVALGSYGGRIAIDDTLGLLLVGGKDLSAFTLNGKPRWTTPLSQLFQGEYPAIQRIVTAPDQRLLFVDYMVGSSSHQSWLVAIDADSGAVKWSRAYGGHISSLARDPAGQLLTARTPCWGTTQNEETVDAATGAILSTSIPRWVPAWTSQARVVSDTQSAVLDAAGQELYRATDYGWMARIGREHVYWYDYSAYGVFTLSLKTKATSTVPLAMKGYLDELFVTDDDGALLIDRPNSATDSSWVTELAPDGSVSFSCEVPHQIFSTALGDERLYAKDPVSGFHVYSLPGVKAGRHGFTSTYGSPGMTGPLP